MLDSTYDALPLLDEVHLFEVGFTGEKKVMVRGKEQTWCYVNGRRTSCNPEKVKTKKPAAVKPEPKPKAPKAVKAPKPPKPPKPVKPPKPKKVKADPKQVTAHAKELLASKTPATKEQRIALVQMLGSLTLPQINAIGKELNIKAKGKKEVLISSLVDQLVAAVKPGVSNDNQTAPAGKGDKQTVGDKPVSQNANGTNPVDVKSPEKKSKKNEVLPPAGISPKPPEPGFTGTDTLGRKWVNGEMVPGEEEELAPRQSKYPKLDVKKMSFKTKVKPASDRHMKILEKAGLKLDAIVSPNQTFYGFDFDDEEDVELVKEGLLEPIKGQDDDELFGSSKYKLTKLGLLSVIMKSSGFTDGVIPAPTNKKSILTITNMYEALGEDGRAGISKVYGIDPKKITTPKDFHDALNEMVHKHYNPESVEEKIRSNKELQEHVNKLSHIESNADAVKEFQTLAKELNTANATLRTFLAEPDSVRRTLEWNNKYTLLRDKAMSLFNRAKEHEITNAKHKSDVQAILKKQLTLESGKETPITSSHYDDNVSPEARKTMDEGMAWLTGVVAKGPNGESLKPLVIKNIKPRAHYNADDHFINVGGGVSTSVCIHEMAHAIECTMPGAIEAALHFLEYRVKDEKPQFLSKVMPDGKYDAHEVGRKDQFDKALKESLAWYVGKKYNKPITELLPMGIEALYNDPGNFARKDPEFCAFVIGMLNGSLRYNKIPDD